MSFHALFHLKTFYRNDEKLDNLSKQIIKRNNPSNHTINVRITP